MDITEKNIDEILVILGEENSQHNFAPIDRNINPKPFIEVEKGLVGDTVLRFCIIDNALSNFKKFKKKRGKSVKKGYSSDILIINNKEEIAIVFKSKKNGTKNEYIDNLPIIRYDKSDTSSILSCVQTKLQEELKIIKQELLKNRVSIGILTTLFPFRYLKRSK